MIPFLVRFGSHILCSAFLLYPNALEGLTTVSFNTMIWSEKNISMRAFAGVEILSSVKKGAVFHP